MHLEIRLLVDIIGSSAAATSAPAERGANQLGERQEQEIKGRKPIGAEHFELSAW